MGEQIKDNFEMYREKLVGDDVGEENEDNDEDDEENGDNEENEEMVDDENQKNPKSEKSRNPSGTSNTSSPQSSQESETLTRIGSILEKSSKSNQIALGNCLSMPDKNLDSSTALEQLQIEMLSPDFHLKNLILNILKNTYMKCLTFPLVDADIREKWEESVKNLKSDCAMCDLIFLVFVLETSINNVNRRGRRANSNDLTLEEQLLQVVEEEEVDEEQIEESEVDETGVGEEIESEGEIVYSRSGRRQKQIKRYVDEFEHREESEEEIVSVKRGSYKKTEKQKAKEKRKYFDEFESPEILPTSRRRARGGKSKKEEAGRTSGRTSGRTTRKTYKDSSSDEDMEESQDEEVFEKLPTRSRRNR